MNINLLLRSILIISLVLFGLLYAVLSWLRSRDQNRSQQSLDQQIFHKNKLRFKDRWQQFLQASYVFSIKIPLLSSYVRKIRKRLSGIHAYDEYHLRLKVMNLTLTILGILSISLILLYVMNSSLAFILLVAMTAVVINSLLIDMYVNSHEKRLLLQMVDLFSDVRHRYHQHGMVVEALYESTETAGHEVSLHVRKIYAALNATDPSEELERYYEASPNRFLKAFAGISYMIMEFGDKVKEQGSIYLQGLSGLTKEIHLEILRRSRLDYLLKGLNLIALAPVFFTKPIEHWARNSFPAMDEFYMSKLGYIAKILIYVIIIIAYLFMQKLQQYDETSYRAGKTKRTWEQMLSSIDLYKRFTLLWAPKPQTPGYAKMVRLLKDSNTATRYEWFYIRRFTLFLLTFVVSMSVVMFLHTSARNHIMYDPVSGDHIFGQMTADQKKQAKQLSDKDLEIMKEVNMSPTSSYEDIASRLENTKKQGHEKDDMVTSANRIVQKLEAYGSEYLKWWELLLCISISFTAYQFPLWMLYFQRKVRYMDMRHEVYEFHTVISMLREMDRISVEEILEWMDRFAVIFKIPIQRCLINFDNGAELALHELKEEIRFADFQRIVDKLLLAVEKIPVAQAFDDLESEMSFYFEQRKQEYEKTIDTKAGLGKIIGFTPMYALIFMYLVIPLIGMSFVQMSVYYEQIQKI
ncbi:hypothetical protein [Paenibacillus pini]|uniref:Uncharacterized protein n=1 Tax=Paenibacillus pini JCM 16418 TaxID=1236976 RepID=W7YGC6_9BACL|nr:hypothetical protein [Paenibacillus pini]GAF07532.1 hypothetical protein JCM16418_1550 [Paenibacillus pini JCM 16418]